MARGRAELTPGSRALAPLGLWVAALAYVLLRAAILWTHFDEVAMPAYELYPMGTLPRVLLEPGGLPLARYYDNAAGQIVTGFLALLPYLAFGPTYLALKLVPAALGLAALVTLFFLLRRVSGERAATLGALFFALAPTTLSKYSLLASGNHFENLFFTLFTLLAFVRLHALGRTAARLAAAGFAAGFSIFVFLGAITPVALLFLVHLGLRGWRGTLRDLLVLAPAFAAGIAPLIALNLLAEGRGLAFLEAKFSGPGSGIDPGLFAARGRAFFAEHLPAAGTYPSFLGVSGRVAGGVFLACFVFAYLFSLPEAWRGAAALARGALGLAVPGAGSKREQRLGTLRRSLLVVLVLYLPLTAVAFARSNLVIGGYARPVECGGYRYFLPHFTFAILLIAITSGRLLASRLLVNRSAGVALAAAVLATGTFNLALVDPGAPVRNLGAHYEGSNYKQTARALLTKKNELPHGEVVRYAEEFAPVLRERVYEGLGFYGAWEQSLAGGIEALDPAALLERYPSERGSDLARGFGVFLRQPRIQGPLLPPASRERLRVWSAQGVGGIEHVVEGLASPWNVVLSSALAGQLEDDRRLLGELDLALQPSFARGFGCFCGRILRREIPTEAALVAREFAALREELVEAFLFGLGQGLADGADRPSILPSALALAPAQLRRALHAGFDAREREIWGNGRAAQAR